MNVKVVSVYIGPRRSRPRTGTEAIDLLGYVIRQERTLDAGVPCDTVLAYNRSDADPTASAIAERLLAKVDGKPARNGRFRVLARENYGLSFGAFSHAFAALADEYDYWFFCEDDQVVIRDGAFATAVRQLERDPSIGYVAVVGVSPDGWIPAHAHGGVGVTRRDVLERVRDARGKLPFRDEGGYTNQEAAEVEFTNSIHQLGYRLDDLEGRDWYISWGQPHFRTIRTVAWSPRYYGPAREELARWENL